MSMHRNIIPKTLYALCGLSLLVLQGFLQSASAQEGGDYAVTNASMRELLVHAQQYGNTHARRQYRANAREELFARGTNSLHYLLDNFHLQNMAVHMLSDEMVRTKLDDDAAADVLLQYIESEDVLTRKSAVYFLGHCDTPQHAELLMPLLLDDKAAGAAARTLGKWAYTNALEGILPQLESEEERRRILAVNALSDIGDPAAIPHFLNMLDDSIFTVRKAAQEALVRHGAAAAEAGLHVMQEASVVAQREIMLLWVDTDYLTATNALLDVLNSAESPSLKAAAQRSIEQLSSPRH